MCNCVLLKNGATVNLEILFIQLFNHCFESKLIKDKITIKTINDLFEPLKQLKKQMDNLIDKNALYSNELLYVYREYKNNAFCYYNNIHIPLPTFDFSFFIENNNINNNKINTISIGIESIVTLKIIYDFFL